MSIDLKAIRDAVVTRACTAGTHADRFAQHVNVYRVASHFVGSQTKDGIEHYSRANFANNVLGEFDTHDQDKDRPEWARKLQLSRCGDLMAKNLSALMIHAQKKPINNQALLYQIARTRLIVFGDKNLSDSLAYARRASRKLHPDLNASLNGWHVPGTKYFRDMPANYRYEHARHGAAALFLLHNNLKTLLSDEHYQSRLYSKRVLRGGSLTIAQMASDVTVAATIGALICITKRKSLAVLLKCSALSYAVLLLAFASQIVVRKVAARKQVKCREVVLYRPTGTP